MRKLEPKFLKSGMNKHIETFRVYSNCNPIYSTVYTINKPKIYSKSIKSLLAAI